MLDVFLIVIEAAGGLGTMVAATLASAGLPLAVVNPRQNRDFARAFGRLAKTDAIDAEVIALFAERAPPSRGPSPPQRCRTTAGEYARRLRRLDARRLDATSPSGGDEAIPRNAECPVSGRFRLFPARPL